MGLFQLGDFILNGGTHSSWKIDCDALTNEDMVALTQLVRCLAGDFSSVKGVPTGGTRLAEWLRPFCTGTYHPHLIVDDVLTTGASMDKAFGAVSQRTVKDRGVRGVVLFARGSCSDWITPLFQMPQKLWTV